MPEAAAAEIAMVGPWRHAIGCQPADRSDGIMIVAITFLLPEAYTLRNRPTLV